METFKSHSPAVSRLCTSGVVILLVVSTCYAATAHNNRDGDKFSEDPLENVKVSIGESRLIHVTDERYLSVAWTIGDLRKHWHNVNLSSVLLQTLAKGLSPSYLRFGGTRANLATFKEKSLSSNARMKKFFFTGTDWDRINDFSRSVGWSFIFDVNAFWRRDNTWDPTNFEALLKYNDGRGYNVTAWQLGNEPDGYKRSMNVSISPKQVAADYIRLQEVLTVREKTAKSFIIGPDVTKPHQKLERQKLEGHPISFLEGFLSECGNCTNVTTFHSYYLQVKSASLDDFYDPAVLNTLAFEIHEVRKQVRKYRPHRPKIWLTETGDSVPGGVSGISDRYVGGFPFLDKLGTGAKNGLDVVMKQQFIGRFCGLVDSTNTEARPVYWVAYIHKRLVGERVLNVSTNIQTETLRIYAHCTQTRYGKYSPGAVTLIVINLHKSNSYQLDLQGTIGNNNKEEHLMTPSGTDGIQARYVSLNNIKLEMLNDRQFPELSSRLLTPKQTIKLPPLTYGFYVIPKANLKICK
ncbi:heparanase-like [Asterias amurensis]|uniref:heparanase-like n=1 Tax=Asterias amurensis TaxID=7602 RepID=UPI003AB8FBA9